MGIKHMVLAVNKMDLLRYDKHRFDEIKREFLRFVADYELESIQVIPVSATEGDNITKKSAHTPWYQGLPLLSYLEQIDVQKETGTQAFIMPVQRVCRPSHEFRCIYRCEVPPCPDSTILIMLTIIRCLPRI
jgi:sulfate adenylyltransferase subunit 1 (EFTu-like GTPase family)